MKNPAPVLKTRLNMKRKPDAENLSAIGRMLRNAYQWGRRNGYITYDAKGTPVFKVPEKAQKAQGAQNVEAA